MTTYLTDAVLREALTLAEKATPGPWEWRFRRKGDIASEYHHASLLGPENQPVITANDGAGLDSEYPPWHSESDKRLIAAAREGWPAAAKALLATRAALRELSEAAKKPLDDMDKQRRWPVGEQRAEDHTPYYHLRLLIGEASALLGEPPSSLQVHGKRVVAP